MTERYNEPRKGTQALVLLIGLGAVLGSGYWSENSVKAYASHQMGDDWRNFSREVGISDDEAYAAMTGKIGSAATQCFVSFGGKGISRVVQTDIENKPAVIYRIAGNEAVDPVAAGECIYTISGRNVDVLEFTVKHDDSRFSWEIFQNDLKNTYEDVKSRILKQ